VSLTEELKIGNPLNADTDISAMIDEANTKRIDDWVTEAISTGAKLIAGGKVKNGVYLPTILTNTKPSMRVCSNEVFGPVVSIEPYENFSKAIDEVNSSAFGLQAGVFTNKLSEEQEAFSRIKIGGVIINDTPTFRIDHMPYGGVKNSGLGREGVKYAIHNMLEPRILVRSTPL